MPYILKWGVDNSVTSVEAAVYVAISFAVFSFLGSASSVIRSRLASSLSNSINIEYGSRVVSHLLSLPVKFFKARSDGVITSRLDSVDGIRNLITNDLLAIFVDSAFIFTSLIMMCLFSWKLTIVATISSMAMLLLYRSMLADYANKKSSHLIAEAKRSASILETLGSIEQIKSTNTSAAHLNHWVGLTKNAGSIEVDLIGTVEFAKFVRGLILSAEVFLVLYFSMKMVGSGVMTNGDMVGFIMLRLSFFGKLEQILEQFKSISTLKVHFQRLDDIMNEVPEPESQVRPDGFDIEFRDVSFSYENNNILEGVSLKVSAGSNIAISGKSGCGKTTILKLIQGIELPTSGEVLIGGVSTKDIGSNTLRQSISVCMQGDQCLFEGKFSDNISMFDPITSIERLHTVVFQSCLESYVDSLSNHFESFMAGGETLSGGQMQRIVLARALYRGTPVLLLDEATSHLDSATEAELMSRIKNSASIIISVAHREETLKLSDTLLTLEGKKVVQRG
nr:ATP-binding cassette domain-containing protein [uncultured Pseudoteredinibacter sp.]